MKHGKQKKNEKQNGKLKTCRFATTAVLLRLRTYQDDIPGMLYPDCTTNCFSTVCSWYLVHGLKFDARSAVGCQYLLAVCLAWCFFPSRCSVAESARWQFSMGHRRVAGTLSE